MIRDQSFQKVENLVKMHPAVFRQTFQRRFVNNIYFDSYNYKNYFENVDGDFNRLKIRIRWYGSLFGHIKKPILELKIKNSHLGEKKSFQLPVFEINQGFNISKLFELVNNSNLQDNIKHLLFSSKPTLLNRYSRNYYVSANGDFRITIDKNLEYYKIGENNNNFINKNTEENIILELKYDESLDGSIISNSFPYRVSKNSKYVNGIERVIY